MRTIAIDWSGRASGEAEYIWAASVVDGRLQDDLVNGRTREQITDWLTALVADGPVVVGLDFGFSFPRWWCERSNWVTPEAVWHAVAADGDAWLERPSAPFWGRTGLPRDLDAGLRLRRTEEEVAGQVKSIFQIGGAGAVGTGSIRGMPVLLALSNAGYSVWPFHAAHDARVVEIYPRALLGSGPVRKSRWSERHAYLFREFPDQPTELLERAAGSEDAFDATIAALAMIKHTTAITRLPASDDRDYRIEGRIWTPEIAA